MQLEVDRRAIRGGGELHVAGAEMLHQGYAEAAFDEEPVWMLHVGNIDQVWQPAALIGHREIHAVFRNSERDIDPPVRGDPSIGLDRIRHGFRRDPTQIIESIAIKNVCCGRCRSNDHPDNRDEVRARRYVDVDDMQNPAGRGAHRSINVAHAADNVREHPPILRATPLTPLALLAVDSVWEQWDLVCADPVGCDELDRLMRGIVWAYVIIGWMIFYAALRPWTTDLPKAVGAMIATLGSALIVWISIGIVGSSSSLRTAGIITAIGLIAVWIGRPNLAQRSDLDEVSAEASPTSSTR